MFFKYLEHFKDEQGQFWTKCHKETWGMTSLTAKLIHYTTLILCRQRCMLACNSFSTILHSNTHVCTLIHAHLFLPLSISCLGRHHSLNLTCRCRLLKKHGIHSNQPSIAPALSVHLHESLPEASAAEPAKDPSGNRPARTRLSVWHEIHCRYEEKCQPPVMGIWHLHDSCF